MVHSDLTVGVNVVWMFVSTGGLLADWRTVQGLTWPHLMFAGIGSSQLVKGKRELKVHCCATATFWQSGWTAGVLTPNELGATTAAPPQTFNWMVMSVFDVWIQNNQRHFWRKFLLKIRTVTVVELKITNQIIPNTINSTNKIFEQLASGSK